MPIMSPDTQTLATSTDLNVVAIVQARMSSSRLPGKVLRPLGSKPVLDWVIDAIEKSNTIQKIILATSEDDSDDEIETYARDRNIECFRGSLDDVLGRFIGAVEAHCPDSDAVVRITADCPLLDARIVDMVAGAWLQAPWVDYISTAITRCMPRGMDAEIISTSALRKINELATEFHRVHVTSYAYTHPEEFSVFGVQSAKDYSHLRVTLDTQEDYELLQAVVAKLNGEFPTLENVVQLLTDHPELVELNAAITQKQLVEG